LDKITVIGTIAAVCTTISFLPQVIKIYRTKSARDISTPMYIIFSFGVASWTYYGILTRSMPVIAANSVTFLLCVFVLLMKMKY